MFLVVAKYLLLSKHFLRSKISQSRPVIETSPQCKTNRGITPDVVVLVCTNVFYIIYTATSRSAVLQQLTQSIRPHVENIASQWRDTDQSFDDEQE